MIGGHRAVKQTRLQMKYLIFGGSHYYPAGGWKDLLEIADTPNRDIAIAMAKKHLTDDNAYKYERSWVQVVDPFSFGIIYDSTKDNTL